MYPITSFVLHEVVEYQKKDFLFYHSAKLAVTYGSSYEERSSLWGLLHVLQACFYCNQEGDTCEGWFGFSSFLFAQKLWAMNVDQLNAFGLEVVDCKFLSPHLFGRVKSKLCNIHVLLCNSLKKMCSVFCR